VAAHPKVAEREVEANRVAGVGQAQGARDLLGGAPGEVAPAGEPQAAGHSGHVGVERHQQRRGGHLRPEAEIDAVRAANHPAQVEVPPLGRAAGPRIGAEVADPAPASVGEQLKRRWRLAQLRREAGQRLAKGSRRPLCDCLFEQPGEARPQRPVPPPHPAGRGQKRRDVLGRVEAVAESGQGRCVGVPGEARSEGRRGWSGHPQHRLDPGLEYVGPAVGEAGGEKSGHLGVSRVGVAARELHRVGGQPRRRVEPALEAVEDRSQPRGPAP